jgi:hypothetical protein
MSQKDVKKSFGDGFQGGLKTGVKNMLRGVGTCLKRVVFSKKDVRDVKDLLEQLSAVVRDMTFSITANLAHSNEENHAVVLANFDEVKKKLDEISALPFDTDSLIAEIEKISTEVKVSRRCWGRWCDTSFDFL